MRALLVLVGSVVLAGCVGLPGPEDAGAVAAVPSIQMEDCTQTHTFASYPVEGFDGMLPAGWTVQPADPLGRTTQFYLAGSICALGTVHGEESVDLGEAKEVLGFLFVVPPNGTTPDVVGDLWPLGGFVSHGDLVRIYEAWGLADVFVQGTTEIALDEVAGGFLASRTYAEARGETFEVAAALREEPADFHEGTFRIWIPGEDDAAGSLRYEWPPGEEIGLGPGEMRYDGPLLNAPPVGPVVVHHVRGVSSNLTAWTDVSLG